METKSHPRIRITQEYKAETLRMLIKMGDQEVRSFNPEAADDQKTIEAIKIIIDWEQDIDNGFDLTFSTDYRRMIKRRR